MKKLAKNTVVSILGWQVRRLRQKNKFKIIAVAGSIGKTSTKFAVAKVLEQRYRVRYQAGNYNDPASVPLIFFNHDMPSLFNPIAWLRVFLLNEWRLRQKYEPEVVVIELGTDGPGQMAQFANFVQPDISILTAIAPEHMEFFKTVDAVAEEELTISNYSKQLLINSDLCDEKYVSIAKHVQTYAIDKPATFQIINTRFTPEGYEFEIIKNHQTILKSTHPSISKVQLYSLAAAVATGTKLGMSPAELKDALKNVSPVSGRMQVLEGINGAVIWDDTYNASPVAVKSALDALYLAPAEYKIALLGNMNELGDYSEQAHTEVGNYCDASKLDLVLTIGDDANKFLSAAAEARGCHVYQCKNALEAAEVLKRELRQGTILLAKGSQNRVFAEEAVKRILKSPADSSKLVRQSPAWLKIKEAQFNE